MNHTSLFRRAAALGCAALLTIGLTACGKKKEPQTEDRLYRNGTYTAQFDAADQNGYTTYAVVEIADDKVSVTEFDGRDSAGNRRSADSKLADSMKEGASEYLSQELTPAALASQAMANLAAAGGDPDQMAPTAGGPEYGLELAALVNAVLDGPARADAEGESTQVSVPYYADGNYRVTVQDFDLSGYQEYIRLKVSGGIPTVEEFDALDKEEKHRSQDTQIKPKVPYSESVPALVDSFNSAKTVEGIETVTGATESSDCFRLLVGRALENAHLRYTADDTVDVIGDGSGLKDGIYKAEMSEFEHGWKDYVVAQVWRGRVVVAELDSVNESGGQKIYRFRFCSVPQGEREGPRRQRTGLSGPDRIGVPSHQRGASGDGKCSGRHHLGQQLQGYDGRADGRQYAHRRHRSAQDRAAHSGGAGRGILVQAGGEQLFGSLTGGRNKSKQRRGAMAPRLLCKKGNIAGPERQVYSAARQ